jgi:uncharacterized protein (DUF433 family)
MTNGYVKRDEDGYWVAETRISLDSLVRAFNRGASPETIKRSFSLLTLEEVYGAITYYLAHEAEIDEYLSETEKTLTQEADVRRQCLRATRPELYQRLKQSSLARR